MTKYNSLIVYGVSLLLAGLVGFFIRDKTHTCPVPEERIDIVTLEIKDSTGYEPQIKIVEIPANGDSIYRAAQIWWQEHAVVGTIVPPETADGYLYIASKDTTYGDSTLQANIQFNSRIVLDPEAYFNLKFKVREKIITETVYETEQGTYNPYFFVEGGMRVGNTFHCYVSAGVNVMSYRHLKLPIYYEMEHAPEGGTTHSLRSGVRIEF